MKKHMVLGFALVGLSVAGCNNGTSDGGGGGTPLLGPGATIGEAETAWSALTMEGGDIFDAEGTTIYANRPGSASFTGMIVGEASGGSGRAISHAADLSLTVDLSGNNITGSATNFVTTLAGFENPAGTLSITGVISESGGEALIELDGDDLLTQGDLQANYDFFAAEGTYGGTDGRVIYGSHDARFFWTMGPDEGEVSNSFGEFAAIQD